MTTTDTTKLVYAMENCQSQSLIQAKTGATYLKRNTFQKKSVYSSNTIPETCKSLPRLMEAILPIYDGSTPYKNTLVGFFLSALMKTRV